MHVIFIHGPAASGKHTVGERLSARTGLPLFHNHLAVDAAKSLFEFGTPGFRNLRAAIWQTAFAEAAAAGRSFIFTFHPEASVDPGLIARLLQSVREAGGQVFFVELRCATATLLQRLANPSRAKFGKLTDRQLFQALERQGAFAFPALPEALLHIDTDEHAPEAAAALIAGALARATAAAAPG